MAITKPADILNVDLAVRADSLQDDIFQIYKVLQPSAKRAQLKFEELRGGYVNSIWRVSKNASKGETNSVTNSSIEGSLVFRSFGRHPCSKKRTVVFE